MKPIKLKYFVFLGMKQNATDGLQQYPATTYRILIKQLHVRDFGQKSIQKYFFGKPRPANPLSVFPGNPESQILTQPNLPRNTKKTSNESRNVTPDESPAFNEKDTISSFEELGPVYTVRKILSLQA